MEAVGDVVRIRGELLYLSEVGLNGGGVEEWEEGRLKRWGWFVPELLLSFSVEESSSSVSIDSLLEDGTFSSNI